MSTATTSPVAESRTVTLHYPGASDLQADAAGARLLLALDATRGTVGLRGRVTDPALFRDALLCAAAIRGSDLRYKRRDRAAYLAYLAKQGKKATKEIWEAQKQFLDEAYGEEKQSETALDPILTVHPDELSLEVFSRDESTYARLAFQSALFSSREAAHGTACVDLSEKIVERIDRMRTYLPVDLDAGAGTRTSSTPTPPRALQLPPQWLRGFLQVQSAATLPATTCPIAPIDLYNVLYTLRTRKAKKPPRALRFEMVPGAPPRLVVEPWEIVLEGHGPAFAGSNPRVVRTFGRQRLLPLARVLPHAKSVQVRLTGAGLPVFWVLDLGLATLTVGLTGWTESGWSSAAAFDALMPGAGAATLADRLLRLLDERGPQPLAALQQAAGGASIADTRAALQLLCLRGRVVYDLARDLYRPRSLLAEPVDERAIRYGSERERRAHRLLGDSAGGATPKSDSDKAEVRVTKIHDLGSEGQEISGEVVDKEAHRSFSPRFTLDVEGRVRDAGCGCPTFRRAGLREGPCEHMIALRIAWARRRAEEEAMRQTPEGRRLIRAETRTWVRREPAGAETVYRVSLDEKAVAVEWGPRGASPRRQRLWFDSDAEARDAYFARLETLAREGYIDADAV